MTKKSKTFFFSKLLYIRWGVCFLVFGLALNQLIIPSIVYALPSLFVEISASPSSGNAPLNGVDLAAAVSGTATGDITYQFDCTNDGSWERTLTTSSTSYTAIDLCNYSSPGNYIAKVSAEREGLVFQGTTAILVQSGSGLSVDLSANPSSGSAPLYNVDLTATVSGTATGDITYRFDCTSDGSWERVITASASTYTAVDLCNYSSPGNYIAKVFAERGGLTSQGTTVVMVNSEEGASLSVRKLVRNLSDGTSWLDSVDADPSEIISFSIQVTNIGSATVRNIIIKDTLPNKIIYQGDLKVDNLSSGGNIISGLDIGDLSVSQSKTITFQTVVASEDQFSYGATNLTNTALAYTAETANTDTAIIVVSRKAVAGVATAVITGITNNKFLDYILLPFGISLLLILFLKNYFILLSERWEQWLEKSKEEMIAARSERILRKKIAQIKVCERS